MGTFNHTLDGDIFNQFTETDSDLLIAVSKWEYLKNDINPYHIP